MSRELPLLLGTIGTVLGFFTLPWLLVLFLGSGYGADCQGCRSALLTDLFVIAWAVSPFLGLAGAFNVKKHGKLGGLLFVASGTLPWIGAIISSNVSLVAFFWTPLLLFAGILAISDRPGTYVDEEMDDEFAEESSSSD
jgi:hypothetical protein